MMSQDNGPVAAVTGADGYFGSIVSSALAEAGFQVRRLVRQPEVNTGDRYYDIAGPLSSDVLDGTDVLIHCAYDYSVTSRAEIWSTNVYGTRTLLDLAAANGVRRTIVESSMSAYSGTQQIYGRARMASEIDAMARDMCVIRPGLIYGSEWGGMAGTLRKLTSLPLVPHFGRQAHQFTLHEDDLRSAIKILAKVDEIPRGPLGLAHPEPVPFDVLMRTFAQINGRKGVRFVPAPWRPTYLAIRAAELMSLNLPIRADSLLGLVRPAASVPNQTFVRELGIELRPFVP
jgi:nucleoside-diphosphate-sugar epimerase